MTFVASSTFFVTNLFANPVDELLERIDKGASHKFKTVLVKSDKDFFEIDQAGTSVPRHPTPHPPRLPASLLPLSSEATLGSTSPWA